jgi:hypothetical protein
VNEDDFHVSVPEELSIAYPLHLVSEEMILPQEAKPKEQIYLAVKDKLQEEEDIEDEPDHHPLRGQLLGVERRDQTKNDPWSNEEVCRYVRNATLMSLFSL